MKPKYYFFSNDSIHIFMKYTQLHNTQFRQGSEFLKLLESYEDDYVKSFLTFHAVYKNDGLYLFSDKDTALHGFVLDVDNIRNKKRYENNVLLIIEKFFRIYIKIDQNYPLSTTEIHINGTTNYIVNPFSYSPSDGFIKYIINVSPEQKRDSIRGIKLFLNTIDGTGQLDYNDFKKANYHKVIDSFQSAKNLALSSIENKSENNENSVTVFEFEKEKKLDLVTNYIGFTKWEKYLTNHQKDIVFSNSLGPVKIIGPAGTGKTLSLVLKALFLLNKYKRENKPLKIGFVCHSEAMKKYINSIFAIDGMEFLDENNPVSVDITTLMKWCCDNAVKGFSLDDCLEVDSCDSKLMQQMMIENSIEKFMSQHFNTFEPFLSKEFKNYIQNTPRPKVVESIRNEISVFIKGPNIESLEDYKKGNGKGKILPLKKDEDFSAVFQIYDIYQNSLSDINKYDIDDVSSVALGFLTKAIWKRNRKINGYDAIFVDELHLYDFSEISILKYMLKDENLNHIVCAMDITQSSGDMEIVKSNIAYLNQDSENSPISDLNIVFRSSQPIINLTKFLFDFKLTLFANSNPLHNISVLQNAEETLPLLVNCVNDKQMINNLLKTDTLKRQDRKNTIVVFTDYSLENQITSSLEKAKIPFLVLRNRNDYETLKSAKNDSKLIIGYIDFVGGLEFDNVYLLGFDIGRVPPLDASMSLEFFTHIWYRKIYVAFTRAKKNLVIYSNIEEGEHPFLKTALDKKLLAINTCLTS